MHNWQHMAFGSKFTPRNQTPPLSDFLCPSLVSFHRTSPVLSSSSPLSLLTLTHSLIPTILALYHTQSISKISTMFSSLVLLSLSASAFATVFVRSLPAIKVFDLTFIVFAFFFVVLLFVDDVPCRFNDVQRW
jgi:hypothetical protein